MPVVPLSEKCIFCSEASGMLASVSLAVAATRLPSVNVMLSPVATMACSLPSFVVNTR